MQSVVTKNIKNTPLSKGMQSLVKASPSNKNLINFNLKQHTVQTVASTRNLLNANADQNQKTPMTSKKKSMAYEIGLNNRLDVPDCEGDFGDMSGRAIQ